MIPFTVTVEITAATQVHDLISELLRVFPSLYISITYHEHQTVTVAARAPQTRHDSDLNECSAVCRAIDALRSIGSSRPPKTGHADYLHCSCGVCAAYRRDLPGYLVSHEVHARATSGYLRAVGADEAGKASVPSKPGEHTEAAVDARAKSDKQLAADANEAANERTEAILDRRNDNSDPSYDDTNSKGR